MDVEFFIVFLFCVCSKTPNELYTQILHKIENTSQSCRYFGFLFLLYLDILPSRHDTAHYSQICPETDCNMP